MPTLANNSAVGAGVVGWNLTALGGETAWQLEINRSADFASDDSILYAPGAGANGLAGFPAGQTFFLRARKTNGGNGAWSNVIMATVVQPAAVPAYGGFSIDKAIVVVPDPIQIVGSGYSAAGYPADRLFRDDPASIARFVGDTIAIQFELSERPFDCCAMLGTLCADNADWSLLSFPTKADMLAGTNATIIFDWRPFKASPSLIRKHQHGFHKFDVATKRWVTLYFRNLTWGMIARHLIIGKTRSSVNYSRGAGSAPNDLSKMGRNRFGTPDRAPGWRGRNLDIELSWLNEAEYQTKWADLDTLVGTSSPVLVVTNSKANGYLQDRIGFGEVRQARGENVRGSKYVKSIEVASLY